MDLIWKQVFSYNEYIFRTICSRREDLDELDKDIQKAKIDKGIGHVPFSTARTPNGPMLYNIVCPQSTNFRGKLECLSLASLFRLVQRLQLRLAPTQVRHLSRDPLEGRLLALPTNMRLGWYGQTGTNILAYYETL